MAEEPPDYRALLGELTVLRAQKERRRGWRKLLEDEAARVVGVLLGLALVEWAVILGLVLMLLGSLRRG